MNDQELLNKLKNGDEKALEWMYVSNRSKSTQYAIKKFYRKSTEGKIAYCTLDEAIELYHESIITIVENIREGRLVNLSAKVSTYLVATMKNKWRNMTRKRRHIPLDTLYDVSHEPADEDRHIQTKVRKALQKMDEKCRQMLTLRYFMEWEYEDIALTIGRKNGSVVRNQISRCRKRFKEIIDTLT
ncbi:MAG: sigma-70 family RNA polymerase sigma factor [Bacteroidota bacterium]